MNVPCSLTLLKTLFPRSGTNRAVTGRIPIDFFEQNEAEIRKVMRENSLRAIYRGPRISNNCRDVPSMTRRCDAEAVLLYRR